MSRRWHRYRQPRRVARTPRSRTRHLPRATGARPADANRRWSRASPSPSRSRAMPRMARGGGCASQVGRTAPTSRPSSRSNAPNEEIRRASTRQQGNKSARPRDPLRPTTSPPGRLAGGLSNEQMRHKKLQSQPSSSNGSIAQPENRAIWTARARLVLRTLEPRRGERWERQRSLLIDAILKFLSEVA